MAEPLVTPRSWTDLQDKNSRRVSQQTRFHVQIRTGAMSVGDHGWADLVNKFMSYCLIDKSRGCKRVIAETSRPPEPTVSTVFLKTYLEVMASRTGWGAS